MLHTLTCMHVYVGTRGKERNEKAKKKAVCMGESAGIGVIFCWCQLARGLQINVCVYMCVCAYMYMCTAQTKGPSQTPVNRLARLLRNKGLRANADFTGKRRELRLRIHFLVCVCVGK